MIGQPKILNGLMSLFRSVVMGMFVRVYPFRIRVGSKGSLVIWNQLKDMQDKLESYEVYKGTGGQSLLFYNPSRSLSSLSCQGVSLSSIFSLPTRSLSSRNSCGLVCGTPKKKLVIITKTINLDRLMHHVYNSCCSMYCP